MAPRVIVRELLRRAPLPHWLRVKLRPIARQRLVHRILHKKVSKRVVSRAAPPAELPDTETIARLLPFSMPAHATQKVSIIVPYCNQLAMTIRCLYGLSRHETQHGFEVIAVDDGSDEAGRDQLDQIGGVVRVRHESSQGFVAASNAGAAKATGQYLLFLNNDTFPLPGLLDELVATFDRLPDIGAVGAALVYPNGRLQEAGALIWRNGDGCNIGRDLDPDDPDVCFVRDIDYCSASCLMIRRDVFETLGGFDPRYAPAYYEDSDLCLRVRKAGYRVCVQPLARVIHVEGATAGTHPSRGIKKFQAINRAKFLERWSEELRTASVPLPFGISRFLLPGERRILIVDHAIPAADEDAGSYILIEMITLLQRLGYLIVLGTQMTSEQRTPQIRALERLGVEVIRAPYYRSVVEFLSVHEAEIDLVLMVRHAIAEQVLPQLRGRARRIPTILLNPDLDYLRTGRQADVLGDRLLSKRASDDKFWELKVIRDVDLTITHSERELELLRAELPEKNIALLPWIVHCSRDVRAFDQRDGLLFVGNFSHAPNIDAIVSFVRDLWPTLRARFPEVMLRIVGSHQGSAIQSLAGDGVEIVGHVEDLSLEYDRARVSIAPLRFGAGFKGKVANAMAAGLPSVVTPVAAEGMGLMDGETCLVASLGSTFVDAIDRLYHAPALWGSLSANGLGFAESHWSPRQAEARLTAILQTASVAPTLAMSDRIQAVAAANGR